MTFYVFLVLTVSFNFQSCVQDEEVPYGHPTKEEITNAELRSQYNEIVTDLAVSLNQAIRNSSEFRHLIKSEVQKQFDGDYDLLLSTALTKTVKSCDGLTRSGSSEEISVREILNYYYPESPIKTRSLSSTMDYITSLYPEMQISVPIMADEWDPDAFIPNIAIIPYDYEDLVTEYVTGIDRDGNLILVDAINDPKQPHIVVGPSERFDPTEDMPRDITYLDDSGSFFRPPVRLPYLGTPRLRGECQNSAIRLFWSVGSSRAATINQYVLYRSGPNNSNNFSEYATLSATAITYVDYNVTANKEYVYRLVAKGTVISTGVEITSTSPDFYITASTAVPKAVTGLSANAIGDKRNEIRWTNPSDERYQTKVYRLKSVGSSTTPTLIATLDANRDYYIEENEPGEKWTYTVRKVDSQGRESNSERVYVYNPYRNPDGPSRVYLRKIWIDVKKVEGWLAGKPEFYLSVFGMSPDQSLRKLGSTLDVKFKKRGNQSQDLYNLMHNWSYFNDDKFYPALNFHMIEYDVPSKEINFNISANVGIKYKDIIGLSAGAEVKLYYPNRDKDCGSDAILYFEKPNQILHLQSYGAAIQISEEK